jgi:hypothetical protein
MELILNLVWILLASLAFCQWLKAGARHGSKPVVQLLALAVVALILFPVVSVTDDLQTALNPAESDCCLRRDHACFTPHSDFPQVSAILMPAGPHNIAIRFMTVVIGGLSAPVLDHPELNPIQNRPPPAA